MTSPIQEIKDRLDIVDFIRSYVALLPAGRNFKAPCPFHKEKTPSFIVSPERQTWHCFGSCGEGGDIFKFLMKYENLEFYEALKILAEKAGIELKKLSPAEHRQFGVLFEINQAAKDFFRNQLEKSAESMDYLSKRGLSKETIEEFELGLAPSGFDHLTANLAKSYDVRDIERAGLNFKSEKGSYIDRFRDRIMFPLCDHFGKVVGFSGRILPRLEDKIDAGKYLNSPETAIFSKSKILYGLHKTKNEIRNSESAVLVEGQMDFLALYQDGVRNAVATSGTALTPEHLKTLKRMTDNLVLCFDSDEAGLNAGERAIDLAGANDFSVKLLVLKDFKDPAEAVQKAPGRMSELIGESKPAMEFYFDRYAGKPERSGDLSGFKNRIRIVLGKIKGLASAVERAHWLREFGLKMDIEEKVLAEEMEQLKSDKLMNGRKPDFAAKNSETGILPRRELIAQRLLSLVIAKEELKSGIDGDCFICLPTDYSAILKCLVEGGSLERENLKELFNLISLRSSFEASILDGEKMETEFHELLRQLRLESLREKRRELVHMVKEAEKGNDESGIFSALKAFDEISKTIQNT